MFPNNPRPDPKNVTQSLDLEVFHILYAVRHLMYHGISLALLNSLQKPRRCILVEKPDITFYTYCVSLAHLRNSVIDSPHPSHLFPTIFKNFLRTFSCCKLSFEWILINSLSVTISAALYTRNVINGGSKLNSIACVPDTKGSTVLVIVATTEMREVVASELQSSVTPAR